MNTAMSRILVALAVMFMAGFAEAAAGPYTSRQQTLDATVSGTCGAPSSVIVSTEGSASVGMSVGGTFSATTTAYAYFGPYGWQAISAIPWAGGSATSTFTAPGAWYWTVVAGATQVCMIVTTTGTGSATVRLDSSATPAPVPTASGGGGPVIVGTGNTGGASTIFVNDAGSGVNQIKGSAGLLFTLAFAGGSGFAGYFELFLKPSAGVTLGTTAPDWIVKGAGSGGTAMVPAQTFLPGVGGGGTGLSYACVTTAGGSSQVACPMSFTYQ